MIFLRKLPGYIPLNWFSRLPERYLILLSIFVVTEEQIVEQ